MSYVKVAYIGTKNDFSCVISYAGALYPPESLPVPRGGVRSPIYSTAATKITIGITQFPPIYTLAAIGATGFKGVWSTDNEVIIIMDNTIDTIDFSFM